MPHCGHASCASGKATHSRSPCRREPTPQRLGVGLFRIHDAAIPRQLSPKVARACSRLNAAARPARVRSCASRPMTPSPRDCAGRQPESFLLLHQDCRSTKRVRCLYCRAKSQESDRVHSEGSPPQQQDPEAPPPSSVPTITAFSFSRVRLDASILSIGVLLRRGRLNTGPRRLPIRRGCTPTLFPASLGLHHRHPQIPGRLPLICSLIKRLGAHLQ